MDVREGETVEFEREMGSGAASVPASDSAIIRMIRECDGDAFEARLSMNQDLTFRYAQAEFERKGLPLGPGEMRTLGILNPDGAFTNLGLLLSDQCPPTMKAAAFSDDSRSVFTERREYVLSGPTLVPAMPSAVEIVSLGAADGYRIRRPLRLDPHVAQPCARQRAVPLGAYRGVRDRYWQDAGKL